MRISHHHHTTLAYCQELQVRVEVFVADSESAYLYQTRSSTLTGRRIRLREARADFDGYIAELLSKSLSQAQLDQPPDNRGSRETACLPPSARRTRPAAAVPRLTAPQRLRTANCAAVIA
ncbi:MAG TPA: hypothetical protein VM818_08380 [Vicinamibacterales bacterium]|nr:hypothetical protein [Vicinamibacterales bacterium]